MTPTYWQARMYVRTHRRDETWMRDIASTCTNNNIHSHAFSTPTTITTTSTYVNQLFFFPHTNTTCVYGDRCVIVETTIAGCTSYAYRSTASPAYLASRNTSECCGEPLVSLCGCRKVQARGSAWLHSSRHGSLCFLPRAFVSTACTMTREAHNVP